MSWFLCQEVVVMCVSLLLDYFVLLTYVSVFMLRPYGFENCISLVYNLKSGNVMPSALLFLKTALAIQCLLWFHKHFRIVCLFL